MIRQNARNVLAKLIVPTMDELDVVTLYEQTSLRYGSTILKLVEKFMDPSFRFSEIS